MKPYCILIAFLAACAAHTEEKCQVWQFMLNDGRVVQAVRLIKIATPANTAYLITLADGSKVSFNADDVLKESDAIVSVSALPPSLNVTKPIVPSSAEAPEPVAQEPEISQAGAPASNETPYENPRPIYYLQSPQRRFHQHNVPECKPTNPALCGQNPRPVANSGGGASDLARPGVFHHRVVPGNRRASGGEGLNVALKSH